MHQAESEDFYLRPLVHQVLEYLDAINAKLGDRPDVHHNLVQIKKEYKEERTDIIGVVDCVSDVAGDHPLLIYGFAPFLPPGRKIERTRGVFIVTSVASDFCYRDIFSADLVPYIHGRVERRGNFPVGAGGFADIWEGVFEGRKVAMKILRQFRIHAAKYARRLWREYHTWGNLSHPNILPFLGYSLELISETSPVPCFISPWMENGTILDYITSYPGTDRLKLLLGVAAGLTYLHTRESAVVHGDIRGGNILISKLGEPVLCDFGLSRMLSENSSMVTSTSAGSWRWMSPELFGGQPVTKESDVWAFGMTILEILTGSPPYQGVKDAAVFQEIYNRQLPSRPGNSQGLNDDIWRIFMDCCTCNPSRRPRIGEVSNDMGRSQDFSSQSRSSDLDPPVEPSEVEVRSLSHPAENDAIASTLHPNVQLIKERRRESPTFPTATITRSALADKRSTDATGTIVLPGVSLRSLN